jgi:hypothetical protein
VGTSRDTSSRQQGEQHDKGKNLGSGLGNITDKDRRDLAGRGDDAPTKDQAQASQSAGLGRRRKDK